VTRFRLTVEYDGRPFMGWQRQSNGPSVQGALERAIRTTMREDATVHAAGRTDAGVHARAMAAHVDIQRIISADRLLGAINAGVRPDPVSIIACTEIDQEFHARFSCVERHYEYVIVNRRSALALDRGLAWRVGPMLDAAAMHAAAQRLVGRHDFTTFRSAHCQAESPVRTLDRLDVTREGERILIHASARSFLHHQVRSMTGCLALVGEGKWSADDLGAALMAKDRAALGFNAPPDGLYFIGADY
jgi:tRNA pseudouridine38-40 synthase